jgi:hypothetical protein
MDTPLRTTDEVFKNLRKQRQFEEDAEHVSV